MFVFTIMQFYKNDKNVRKYENVVAVPGASLQIECELYSTFIAYLLIWQRMNACQPFISSIEIHWPLIQNKNI